MPPSVAVVDYGLGNLHSVARALEAAGAHPLRTSDPREVTAAGGVLLPGVGAFPDAAARLAETGLGEAVKAAAAAGLPVLGVCLGLQLLFEASEEGEGAAGLGLFPGRVVPLPGGPGLKIPHMGWNTVTWEAGEGAEDSFPLFRGLRPPVYFYFVHSFAVPADGAAAAGLRVAACRYGIDFVAAAARGNVMGTQFHPEKSGAAGLALYRNFVDLCRDRGGEGTRLPAGGAPVKGV